MPTSLNNRTTANLRDPMLNLEREMKLLNFSRKTIKSYLYYNKEFLRFANTYADEVNSGHIKDYLEFLITQGKSRATIDLVINALKFYYGKILHRSFFHQKTGIKRPKKEKKLPVVLSKEEIARMISAAPNRKHKLLIQIAYSSGLRVSEVRNLRIDAVDFGRKIIFVKQGKGKKDRITKTSETVLRNFKIYLRQYRPMEYVF
jgi:integrase/recombinase XerD